MKKTWIQKGVFFSILLAALAFLGHGPVKAADPDKGEAAIELTLPDAWMEQFEWRSIGPACMGGRTVDIAVYEADPNIWWIATASGGLLKTENNGITFTHQFEHENTVSIGDVAVAPSDPKILWVGTGEANPRNSVSWGDGVYKSVDGGATWKHMGLKDSFQIGRIQIHPEDPNIVYVGALGRLWGPNEERGLFKTMDGGETWEKILFIDEKTGVIDVQMHPEDPDMLLAAAYERQRDGYDSNDPAKKWGSGSGIYKTSDGGKTFKKCSTGLPSCQLGRIGLNFYRADPDKVYAIIESEKIAQEPENAPYMGIRGEDVEVGARLTEIIEEGPAEKAGLKKGDIVVAMNQKTIHSYQGLIREMRQYLADDTVEVEISRERESLVLELTFSKRPEEEEDKKREEEPKKEAEKESSEKENVKEGKEEKKEKKEEKKKPRLVFGSGLGGQRENVQDQQGKGGHEFGGVYMSEDCGETWTRINSLNPRPMYFSKIRVDPSDNNYLYVLGISLYRSEDGGKKFTGDGGRGVHPDHHAMWIDPRDGRHIILGTDGGLYVTYDRMENWDHLNHFAIGQFYHVAVDPRRDYYVYGGLQDNGSWGGPNLSRSEDGPINEDWFLLGWGDGFICRVNPDDPDLVYFESQNGGMGRRNLRTGERGYMRPRAPKGTRYRFNWMTPYVLSHHNPGIFYCAGNHVFRSLKRGDGLKAISEDITNTEKGSASTLAECPFDPDVLYVGTDDGALWRTENGGHEWVCLFDVPEEEKEEKEEKKGKDEDKDKERGERKGKGGKEKASFLKNVKEGLLDVLTPERAKKDMKRIIRADYEHSELEPLPEEKPVPSEAKPEQEVEKKEKKEEKEEKVTKEEEEETPKEDPISGEWTAKAVGEEIPPGEGESTLTLKLGPGGKVTGTMRSVMGEVEVKEGEFDHKTGKIKLFFEAEMMDFEVSGKLKGSLITGTIEMAGGAFSFEFEAKRTSDAKPAVRPIRKKTKTEEGEEYLWKPIKELMPDPRWVSCIEPSRHKEGRVYLAFDGHRSDDDAAYVFLSEDLGKTWRSIRANLPPSAGTIRVIREDIKNPEILYVGTEFSAWISLDRGRSWTKFNNNLPTVAVHEFAQHPTSGEIVAGTHGRSLWILDVSILRQMTEENLAEKVFLFTPNTVYYWQRLPGRGTGNRKFVGENPSSEAHIYYSINKKPQKISLKITTLTGEVVRELESDREIGLHRVTWNMRRETSEERRGRYRRAPRVEPGEYLVVLTTDNQTLNQLLRVERDPEYPDAPVWGEEYEEAFILEQENE